MTRPYAKELLVKTDEQQTAILERLSASEARLAAIEARLAEISLSDITTFEPMHPAAPEEEI